MKSQLRNGSSVCYRQPESLSEVENLKRDHTALRAEAVKLKQQYSICKSQLLAMEQRVLSNERKQQQIITFFVKSLSNPVFLQQIWLNYGNKKELGSTVKRQRLMENEEQHVVDALLKKGTDAAFEKEVSISAGSSDCGTVENDEPMRKWNDQNIGDMCDDVWEELDAIPGIEMKQEGKADIGFDVEEFTGRPCSWVDDCPYLVEPLQFVEH